jgi:hypothetical protein
MVFFKVTKSIAVTVIADGMKIKKLARMKILRLLLVALGGYINGDTSTYLTTTASQFSNVGQYAVWN